MKYFAPLVVVAVIVAGSAVSRADDGYDCNAQPDRSYRVEQSMGNEYEADDYIRAYVDARRAAEIRGQCVDETTGGALEWHLIYKATDLFVEARSARLSGVYPEQYTDLMAAAKRTLAIAKTNPMNAGLKKAYNSGHDLIYGS